MASWESQQRFRKLKEELAVLGKNRFFLLVLAFICLFGTGLYVNSYTARVIELGQKAQTDLSECQGSLTSCQLNSTGYQKQLDVCKNSNSLLQGNVSSLQANVSLCSVDKKKLSEDFKNVSSQLLTCQTSYYSLNQAFVNLNSTFDKLATSSATNICCKKKIDDSSLRYFYVKDGILYCTSTFDESLGTELFSCPSLAS